MFPNFNVNGMKTFKIRDTIRTFWPIYYGDNFAGDVTHAGVLSASVYKAYRFADESYASDTDYNVNTIAPV